MKPLEGLEFGFVQQAYRNVHLWVLEHKAIAGEPGEIEGLYHRIPTQLIGGQFRLANKKRQTKAHELMTLGDNIEAEGTIRDSSEILDSVSHNKLKMKVQECETFIFEAVKETGQNVVGSKVGIEGGKFGPNMVMNDSGLVGGLNRGKGEGLGQMFLKVELGLWF
ncbi:hypothetical protein LWI28_008307 [Acer negundo]|uniref:Uncharacterized protein n=1 Tax=Acer negundo TaxID=4023 RepID=A0AAD5NI59_ACENE|nr:hypothetical protein LWI28_008307 [Acer negundo]